MSTRLAAADLRGRSFHGARLPLLVAPGSDVRGADFSAADLHGADLARIRAGMTHGWTALVFVASLLVSVGLGALTGVAGAYLHRLSTSPVPAQRGAGLLLAATLLAFLVAGIWKGLRVATRVVLPLAFVVAATAGVVAVARGAGQLVGVLAELGFIAVVGAIVMLSVLARAVAGAAGKLFFLVVALSGAFAGNQLGGGLAAVAVALGSMLMARRSSSKDAAYPLIARLVAAVACRGGTRFRDADLTGADLSDARLVACDFRGARLDGARFDGAEVRLCLFDPPSPPSPPRPVPVLAGAPRLRAPGPA